MFLVKRADSSWKSTPRARTPSVNDAWLYFGPGIGLTNSLGSGALYLGSRWNDVPIPSLSDIYMPALTMLEDKVLCCSGARNWYHFEAALGSQFTAVPPPADSVTIPGRLHQMCYANSG